MESLKTEIGISLACLRAKRYNLSGKAWKEPTENQISMITKD